MVFVCYLMVFYFTFFFLSKRVKDVMFCMSCLCGDLMVFFGEVSFVYLGNTKPCTMFTFSSSSHVQPFQMICQLIFKELEFSIQTMFKH